MSETLESSERERVRRMLASSPTWPHGPVELVSATRIGIEHGLSGRTFRVVARTPSGDRGSLVVKLERAEAVERELLFHREAGDAARASVPTCFGGGNGLLLLEDVSPAEQGDVLRGCSDEQADAVVRALARVHGATWRAGEGAFPAELPRWSVRPLAPERWAERLAFAAKRFPQILTPALLARLRDLHVAAAGDRLWTGPAAWIQIDAHLDNVLWRPDGTAVLLDWCDAAIGPPALDLVRCLTEGIDGGSQPGRAAALVSAYSDELGLQGITDARVDLLPLAVAPLVQSAVEWAGRPQEREPEGRVAAIRENFIRCACVWLA